MLVLMDNRFFTIKIKMLFLIKELAEGAEINILSAHDTCFADFINL